MSVIGSVNSLQAGLMGRMQSLQPGEKISPSQLGGLTQSGQAGAAGQTQQTGFSKLFEGMIDAVDAKQTEANEVTRKVLLGQSDQLHQSVIAMQEASVSFSLMVEVRNKLVDSYQELMRMPV